MRAANAIDFWRGLALVMIYVNHVPGNAFTVLTLRNYAISDAAELFVFLAGCSLSYASGGPSRRLPATKITARLLGRAAEIYRAQILITVLALALLAAAALTRNNPLFLEWHNAGPAFYDTTRAIVGGALLSYQIGYFNILPMYVVLLLLAPVFVTIALTSRIAALLVSFTLYLIVLTTWTTLPSWPTEGSWFFNPLSWQLLFVIGFVCCDYARESPAFRAFVKKAVPAAVVVFAAGAALTIMDVRPDPLSVPEPRLFFLFDKMYLSPLRIVSLVAVVVAFYPVFARVGARLGSVTRFLCSLGRNSLPVFSVASLAALFGQIVRFIGDGSLAVDIAIVLSGLSLMGCTAWVSEYYKSAA